MFFVIVVLAAIGLASLLGVTAGSVFAALGALVLIPILLFKIALLFAFFAFAGRAWHRYPRRRRPRWSGRWDREPFSAPQPPAEELFEEWHRMSHARDEVDSWAPEV